MKYVFKALKPLNTCWSVGKKVVEMAVRQLCQLCAARVTWYSFHSCTSDAALLCSQCSRGRCPNVPNGHIHAAKFATASSVIKSENDKKIATRQRLQDVPKKQIQKWKGPSSPDSNCMRSSFSKGKRSYRPKAPPLRSRWHWHGDHPKAPLSDRRGIGMLHTTQRYNRVILDQSSIHFQWLRQ